eukprot:6914199-Prorocentrum_lima.AAC.1
MPEWRTQSGGKEHRGGGMKPQEQCVQPARESPPPVRCVLVAVCGCGAYPGRLHRGALQWAGKAQGVCVGANPALAVRPLRLQVGVEDLLSCSEWKVQKLRWG